MTTKSFDGSLKGGEACQWHPEREAVCVLRTRTHNLLLPVCVECMKAMGELAGKYYVDPLLSKIFSVVEREAISSADDTRTTPRYTLGFSGDTERPFPSSTPMAFIDEGDTSGECPMA